MAEMRLCVPICLRPRSNRIFMQSQSLAAISADHRIGSALTRSTLFQVHLVSTGISWSELNQIVCALRFLYGVTLGQNAIPEHIPYAREPRQFPVVLSSDEVVEFLQAVSSLKARVALTTAYAAVLRVSELCGLRTSAALWSMASASRRAGGREHRVEARLLSLARQFVREFVNVSVVAYFMAIAKDRLHNLRVSLDGPSRNQEWLLEAKFPVKRQDAGSGYLWAVLQHGHRRDQVGRVLVMREVKYAVTILIEGESHRASFAVRPRRRVCDHLETDFGIGRVGGVSRHG